MSKELQIRNSTVDFLVFTRDAGEDGIEVRVQNGDVWLTQKAISQLFDVDRSVVTKHLSNIFKEGELDENSTCANFAQVADNGKTYNYKFYSLAAIIAVGYRINSERAMQFRTWATKVLDTFTKQGYVLDKSRLINGQIFDEDYFEHLIAEIQEIRASERRFYQKITDIYATAVDYDKNSQVTREFYATVQNKMHYAVHGNTAAEVIVARADHNKEHMGLKSWKNAPDGKIVKTDVSIAKNYLEKEELAELNEIVTMYLDYATRQARRHIPMTMEDWKTKLDAFLRFNDADVLQDKGKVTAAIAKEFAETSSGDYNFHRWTSKPTEIYSVNGKQTCKPPELHTIMKKCNGTGLVLKICETKNNVWKKYRLSIQNSIDNRIKITSIKPDSASLNNGLKCRKPAFMRVSGICFIKWL